jgi:hypothetical protein
MDKEFTPDKRLHAYTDRLILYFLNKMNLSQWQVRTRYVERIPMRGEKDGAAADIDCDHTYFLAKLRVARKGYKHWEGKYYRRYANLILHEMAHVITTPFIIFTDNLDLTNKDREAANQISESSTELVAQAILRTLDESGKLDEYMPLKNEIVS